MKMMCIVWCLSILALLITDVRTGFSKEEEMPRRCYYCLGTKEMPECRPEDLSQVTCPEESPYCATIAEAPDYVSSLTCGPKSVVPCTLLWNVKGKFEFTCTCPYTLCNAPFKKELRNELLKFSSMHFEVNRTTEPMEVLTRSPVLVKLTAATIYEGITIKMVRHPLNTTDVPPSPSGTDTVLPKSTNFEHAKAPRAEALKHETTQPSDDDEDEGEGSGSFEDGKLRNPAAPAAPSSLLPANENKAISMHINVLAIVSFIFLCTVM